MARKLVTTDTETPAAGKATKSPGNVYQLKITLTGIRPPIWRRVLVPSTITLAKLHQVIQVVMDWEDDHLHDFTVGSRRDGVRYAPRTDPMGFALDFDDLDSKDEARARLSTVAPEVKAKITYLYDFGDSWEHTILVEKILPQEAAKFRPICVDGKRAGPPEDCGGVWGYAELLEILADPAHEDYEERLEWLGEPIDPEAFDLEQVNRELAELKL